MVDAHPTTADGKKVYALSGWSDWGIWPYMISYPFDMGYTNSGNNQFINNETGEFEDMFTVEDGPLWKALSFYNKAYRMGIMDPEAFTMKTVSMMTKLKTERFWYVIITGHSRIKISAVKMQQCI